MKYFIEIMSHIANTAHKVDELSQKYDKNNDKSKISQIFVTAAIVSVICMFATALYNNIQIEADVMDKLISFFATTVLIAAEYAFRFKAKKQKEATQEEQIKELTDKVDTLSNQIELLVKELVKNDKEAAKKVYKTNELPKGSHATRKRRGK